MKNLIDNNHGAKIALGAEPGHGIVRKFGYNTDVDAAEDVWDYGGTYPYQTSALSLFASSSHAGDTMTFTVQGLDADWEEQSVDVTLTGQSQVAITGTWMRVFRAFNSSDTDLQGNVYIAEESLGGDLVGGVPQTASKVKAMVLLADQQTLMALYTIPAGKTGLLFYWRTTIEGSGASFLASSRAMKIAVQTRENPTGVFRTREKVGLLTSGNSDIERTWEVPLVLPQKTDIKVRCLSTTAENAAISGFFDIVLIDSIE